MRKPFSIQDFVIPQILMLRHQKTGTQCIHSIVIALFFMVQVVITKVNFLSSTKAGKENDSDDIYFDTDEKAEAEKEVVEHDNKINANAALMLRLSLRSNKSAPQHDDDDDDLADDNDR